MKTLDSSQKVAVFSILKMLDSKGIVGSLFGGPGVGKSYTTGRLIKYLVKTKGLSVMLCAPTNKALKIAISNLKGEVEVERPKPIFTVKYWGGKSVVVGTIAQMLGVAPDYVDDDGNTKFGNGGQSILQNKTPNVLVIDEISMVARDVLVSIYNMAKEYGFKIIVVGDEFQLAPVKREAIDLHNIPCRNVLNVPQRNTDLDYLAMLDDAKIRGVDAIAPIDNTVIKSKNASDAFIEAIVQPKAGVCAETELSMDVFIGYTNKVVNSVQDRVCEKLYGHDRFGLEKGQIVICTATLDSGLINNFDYIEIIEKSDIWNETFGYQLTIKSEHGDFLYDVFYHPNPDDPESNYQIELKKALKIARELQNKCGKFKKIGDYASARGLEEDRKSAWREYFEIENAILRFAHPFSMTSHKSQGSTFRDVYIDLGDFAGYAVNAAYVAASRNKGKLVYS